MCKLAVKILLLTILFGQAFYLTPSIAYTPKVHEQITNNAVKKSLRIKSALETIGLLLPGEELDKVKIKNKDLNKWIQRGATWEDNIQFNWGNILFCHFHNPVTDKGYTLPWGTEVGQSLIARAHDATNEWSYEMAKKFYYAALTGDNNEIVDSFTHIRDDMNPNYISRQTNMNKEDRDQYFAWTLQALGHTLHLVQDASVPAHTRNDLHGLFEPYEKWTNKNREDLLYDEEGLEPWTYWSQHADIHTPDVFIDTNQLDNNDTAPISGSDQGIAEYSHANFMSEDTIFTFDLPLKPDLSEFFTNYQSDDFNLETENINGRDMTFVYLKNKHPGGVDHLLLAGVLHSHPISSPTIQDVRWTTNDRKVHEDYASKLIPRAVGYSAGLLDYFFRGQLEITAPEAFVYSVIDGSVGPQQFIHIKAKVKNITPGDRDENGNVLTYEDMLAGTLVAVARYKKRTDYEEDLSTDPPTADSREDDFSYSVSAPVEITSLSDSDPEEFTFNFTESPIPAGIMDLYFQVIFQGTLGNEPDNAIAVGMKDLNEPMHICFWNATDRFYLDGVLRTGQEIRNDPALLERVDIDGDGIVNETGEPYIDPYDLDTEVAFYSPTDTPPNYYHASYLPLPYGRHGRVIMLTDAPTFYLRIHRESTEPSETINAVILCSGVSNQEDNEGILHNTQVSTFRGIIQHQWWAYARYSPDFTGISIAPWPEPEDAEPVPITTINP